MRLQDKSARFGAACGALCALRGFVRLPFDRNGRTLSLVTTPARFTPSKKPAKAADDSTSDASQSSTSDTPKPPAETPAVKQPKTFDQWLDSDDPEDWD